jgi:hypothetical protein
VDQGNRPAPDAVQGHLKVRDNAGKHRLAWKRHWLEPCLLFKNHGPTRSNEPRRFHHAARQRLVEQIPIESPRVLLDVRGEERMSESIVNVVPQLWLWIKLSECTAFLTHLDVHGISGVAQIDLQFCAKRQGQPAAGPQIFPFGFNLSPRLSLLLQ